jgi:DNA-directed RNA polymerase specialized sigma24 family protein
MRGVFEPFALVLYRRHRDGETIEELAAAFGIPEDRVEVRIRAAATHIERERTQSGLLALGDQLSTR